MYTDETRVDAYYTNSLSTPQTEELIEVVSNFIDKHVGYKLAYDNVNGSLKDLVFDASGTDYQGFSNYPVTAYTTIEEDGVDITAYIKTYPRNEDYTTGIGKITGSVPNVFKEGADVEVKQAKVGRYVADLATPANNTLPLDIVRAATILVVSLMRAETGNPTKASAIITGESISNYSYTLAGAGSKQDEIKAFDILGRYTQTVLA